MTLISLPFRWVRPLSEIMPDLPDDVAHDFYGLATWALIVVGFVICTVLIYRIKQGIDETNRHVKNGHKNPMRADIDRIIAQQEHFIARQDDMMARQQLHGTRLAELQQEYQDERQERRELQQEYQDERQERRDDVADLRQTFTRKLSDLAAQIERK